MLSFLVSRGHCCPMVNCLSARKHSSFSAKLFSSCITCTGAWACCSSSAGLDTFPCLTPSNSCQPFPWPVEVPLNSSKILWLISHFSQFVSSADLLRVRSTPSSRSIMKTSNSFGPKTYLLHLLPLIHL